MSRFSDRGAEAAKLGGEIGEGFVQNFGVVDGDWRGGGEAREGERHGQAVVAVGFAGAARKGSAVNREPVFMLIESHAQFPEFAAHDGDAVGLLVAQLFGFTHFGDALREAGCDREDRELIDHADHGVAADPDRLERGGCEADVADGFAGNGARVPDADVCAHLAQHVEDAGARGVEAHVADSDRRAGHERGGHEQEGGGGDVAGESEVQRREGPGEGRHADGERLVGADVGAHGGQHALGVVARGAGFAKRSDAVGGECGEDEAGLHLGAGHGQRAVRGAQRRVGGARVQRERRTAVGRGDADAHGAERIRDAVHGAFAQAVGAVERTGRSGGGKCARQHADGGGRIATEDRAGRRCEAAQAFAVDGQARAVEPPDDAQSCEGVQHGAGDAGDEKTVDRAGALRKGCEKGRAVGERFVSGQKKVARQRGGGRDRKVKRVLHMNTIFNTKTRRHEGEKAYPVRFLMGGFTADGLYFACRRCSSGELRGLISAGRVL